jgi:TubC N-terminal docking domain
MVARALLDRLSAAGLSVTANGDRLQIQPAAKFSDELRLAVVAMKSEMLALLGAAAPPEKLSLQPPKLTDDAQKKELPDHGPDAALTTPTAAVSSEASKEQAAKESRAPACKLARRLERQRARRAKRSRIDYYPSDDAIKALDSLRRASVGGNSSSIIDRVLIGALSPEARA